MRRRVEEVVIWVPRAQPGNRLIPPHLKLAILSRGRIRMPAKDIAFFLDQARAYGATWPDRLTVGLEKIAADYPVTVELFVNQRPELGPDEIDRTIAAYLERRRQQELQPACFLLGYAWRSASERKELEQALGLDMEKLFRRPQVTITPRTSPFAYILLTYVCFSPELARFIRPKRRRAGLPPPPASKMPPLLARIETANQHHLRRDASQKSDSRGLTADTATLVEVLDKRQAEGFTWYNIRLRGPMRAVHKEGDSLNASFFLPKGTQGWIVRSGLSKIVVPWNFFRHDLNDLEKTLSDLNLDARITRLRQMNHSRDLPFDDIIGTRPGPIYRDEVPFVAGTWQFARDYQVVETPDGRWVDVYHLMVGMEVLQHPELERSFRPKLLPRQIPVGTNYSATTWAGDVGQAAADATIRVDQDTWERYYPKATDFDRIQHYFETRVPEYEILGDIDPWGIKQIRDANPNIDMVGDLIAEYYEDIKESGSRTLTVPRKTAIEQFLVHYGFTYQFDRDSANFPILEKQSPVGRLMERVRLFAQIWIYRSLRLADPKFVKEASILFLYWLEYNAFENSVHVP